MQVVGIPPLVEECLATYPRAAPTLLRERDLLPQAPCLAAGPGTAELATASHHAALPGSADDGFVAAGIEMRTTTGPWRRTPPSLRTAHPARTRSSGSPLAATPQPTGRRAPGDAHQHHQPVRPQEVRRPCTNGSSRPCLAGPRRTPGPVRGHVRPRGGTSRRRRPGALRAVQDRAHRGRPDHLQVTGPDVVAASSWLPTLTTPRRGRPWPLVAPKEAATTRGPTCPTAPTRPTSGPQVTEPPCALPCSSTPDPWSTP